MTIEAVGLLQAAEAFALPYYRDPLRAYHNEAHIRSVLRALDERGRLTPLLALAVWGHDLIYDPRAQDNEARSAEEFVTWLRAQHADSTLCGDIQRLILATRHAAPPAQEDEALLLDADLSILGAAAPEYRRYSAAIRQEYGHVPELLYRLGRRKVLQHFLERRGIYSTPEFAALESQARENMRQELRELEG